MAYHFVLAHAEFTHYYLKDLEAHGGLYTLHSHLNHSCAPNVSVRHFDQRTALSRITVVAKRDIEPGDELLITYVNPQGSLKTRRTELEAWGFGTCDCSRCMEETKSTKITDPGFSKLDDLERELKEGLGVM